MTYRFSKQARQFIAKQTAEVQGRMIDAIVEVGTSPQTSALLPYDMPPLVGNILKHPEYWFLFLFERESVIVCNIGPATEPPHLWHSF